MLDQGFGVVYPISSGVGNGAIADLVVNFCCKNDIKATININFFLFLLLMHSHLRTNTGQYVIVSS